MSIALCPNSSNHLIRVLRLTVGSEFRVFNGQGGEYVARISRCNKHEVIAELGEHIISSLESPFDIHLGQSISRGDKTDFILQKAVELGVKKITPLITDRSIVKLSEKRWEKRWNHWNALMISACEQCGRDRIPLLGMPQPFVSSLGTICSDLNFICHPQVEKRFSTTVAVFNSSSASTLNEKEMARSATVLIGPEGGFTDHEFKIATENGYIPLLLGPRILRFETAALAAITSLQSYFGDLSGK